MDLDSKHVSNVESYQPTPTFVRPSFWKRTGKVAIMAFSGSLVIITIVCGFLIFLWTGDENTNGWRNVLLNGWATRAVTLSSLFLRWAIAAQATICTAMLAAIALEHGGVVLSQLAVISSMRFLNSGPYNITYCLLRGQSLNSPERKAVGTVILAIALSLTTLVSQFTSTLLVSDFKDRLVLGNFIGTDIPYGLKYTSGDEELHPYRGFHYPYAQPQSYPMFAEYREIPYVSEGVDDTGPVLRAFLPFGSPSTRNSISEYSGNSMVLDARVTCVRPNFEGGLTTTEARSGRAKGVFLTGTIEPFKSIPSLLDHSGSTNLTISALASYPKPIGKNRPIDTSGLFKIKDGIEDEADNMMPGAIAEWATTITLLPYPFKGLYSHFSNRTATEPLSGDLYLIINTTGFEIDWQDAKEVSTRLRKTNNGVWEDIELVGPALERGTKLSLSLCYSAFQVTNTAVQASSRSNRTEPSILWDEELKVYDTSAIREQLGVPDIEDRVEAGIMDLEPLRGTWPNRIGTSNDDTLMFASTAGVQDWVSSMTSNNSVVLCNYCDALDAKFIEYNKTQYMYRIHPANVALFQDTLRITGRPALAVQSLLTTMVSSAFYDRLPTFTVTTPAVYRQYSLSKGPGLAFKGFTVVMVVVLLHLCLVLIIITWFLRDTQYSLLQNAWQSVSHISTSTAPEIDIILRDAVTMTDKEVDKGLDQMRMRKTPVRLIGTDSEGGVNIKIGA